jgi:hypothetical protein
VGGGEVTAPLLNSNGQGCHLLHPVDALLVPVLQAEEQGRTSSLLDNDYDARFARDLQQMEMMYAAEQGVEVSPTLQQASHWRMPSIIHL